MKSSKQSYHHKLVCIQKLKIALCLFGAAKSHNVLLAACFLNNNFSFLESVHENSNTLERLTEAYLGFMLYVGYVAG